jgi:hypothetical protein
MSWIAAAAAVGGALITANASQGAADTQAAAANQASQVQQQQFGQTQTNLAPWLSGGNLALNQLQGLLGLGSQPQPGQPTQQQAIDLYNQNLIATRGYPLQPQEMNQPAVMQQLGMIQSQDQAPPGSTPPPAAGTPGGFGSLVTPFSPSMYQQSPGYQFQQQQGQQQLNNAAAARGTYYAPTTLQDLSTFNQGLLNTDYQQALQNYTGQQNQVYNMLSGQSGSGQNAAAQLGGFSGQTAGQVGQNITGAANAQAAGQVGGANALSGGISNAYNSYLMQQILGNQQQSIYGTPQEMVPGQYSLGNPAYG